MTNIFLAKSGVVELLGMLWVKFWAQLILLPLIFSLIPRGKQEVGKIKLGFAYIWYIDAFIALISIANFC